MRAMTVLLSYLLILAATAVVAEQPLVSIIIPTYERPLLLRHALSQLPDHPNTEVIVVDDSFQPDEFEELKSFLGDYQVLIYRHIDTRQSIGAKRNLAVELASGNYLIQVDDDDLYSSERIIYQMQPLWEGRAEATVLTHDTWIEFGNESSASPRYWRVSNSDSPHYGTLAFTRELWERLGGFRDSSLAEDKDFWVRAQGVANVLYLPNYSHHAYVRHGHATNPKKPSTDGTGFEEIAPEESEWTEAAEELRQAMSKHVPVVDPRQLHTPNESNCDCCVNANICVEYDQGWDMYDCPLFGPCPGVHFFEETFGSCNTCSSGISCQGRYGAYDACGADPSIECGCCSNPNVCVEYERAWDMYDCEVFGECPEVEFWEEESGPCNTCASGISCQDKYGAYDACQSTPPTPPCLRYRILIIDFERYVNGKVVRRIGPGVEVFAQRKTGDGDFVRAKAMIRNDIRKGRGKALIVSQDSNQQQPKESDNGGKLVFRFGEQMSVRSLGILNATDGVLFRVWTDSRPDDQKIRKHFPNDGYHMADIAIEEVRKLEVQFYGSGAVTDLKLAICNKRE